MKAPLKWRFANYKTYQFIQYFIIGLWNDTSIAHGVAYNQTRWSGNLFYLCRKLQTFYWTFDVTQWHAEILRTQHLDTPLILPMTMWNFMYIFEWIWRFTHPPHFNLNSISICMLKIPCMSSSRTFSLSHPASTLHGPLVAWQFVTVRFKERMRFPCNDYHELNTARDHAICSVEKKHIMTGKVTYILKCLNIYKLCIFRLYFKFPFQTRGPWATSLTRVTLAHMKILFEF
jgi:hypothetical protein